MTGFILWKGLTRWLMNNGYENCQLCGTNENLSFDHIVPASYGGQTVRENLAILCRKCNENKGNNYLTLNYIEWPRPSFGVIHIQDLTVGRVTVFGTVTGDPEVHGCFRNGPIIKVPVDNKGILTEIRKRPMDIDAIFQPIDTEILLSPVDALVGV